MKKYLILLFIVFALILTGCNNTSSVDQTTKDTEKQARMSEGEHYQQALSSFSSLYPTSDIAYSEGLFGTWINTANSDDLKTTMVLALNSDETFNFFVEIIASDSSGTAKGSGTFTYTDNTLNLDFEPNPDNENEPVIIENASYSYKIDGDTLFLTNSENEEMEYYKVDTAAL